MKLVEFSLKRRVTISMCAVALVLFGMVAFTRLPINLLPDLSYPSLTVETRFPGAAPGEVETLVTRPVEEVVGIVSGVQRLTSVSRPGLSQVTLEFGWGRNMDFAGLDVRQKLDLITLPREAERPVVLRFDPANDPVQRLYLTGAEGSQGVDLYRLRYTAEEVLKKALESTEGVAAIHINGGYEEEIQVRLDQGKLSLLGLSIQDVASKLERENVNQAGGSLYEAEARYLVRSRNEFEGLPDIAGTILVEREGRPIKLSDVAIVERGHKQREVVTRFGGKEAVELALYKEGDANTVKVARAVAGRLERIKEELPEGIEVQTGVDQARFIQASISEVQANAWQGALFAVIVLLFFLKDLRSTLVIAITIPISVIATFFLMYRTGTTLNIMSLGGLALGIGNLVDNSIVVLEAIYRRRELGDGVLTAARRGASEVGMAVVASTMTTVAVFVPVVFLEGIAAQLFKDQALTVSFSQIASLIVALTLIPMLAAWLGAGARQGMAGAEANGAPEIKPLLRPAPPTTGRRFLRPVRRGLGWTGFGFKWLFRKIGLGLGIALRFLRRLFGWIGSGIARLATPLTRLFDGSLRKVTQGYPAVLRWALRSRALVIGVTVLAFAFALWLIPFLGFDLIPTFSQGEFSFRVELPEGTPLESTDRYMADVQAVLAGDERVGSYSSIAGGAGLSLTSTGTEGENVARLQVRMAPEAKASDEAAVITVLRERLDQSGMARYKFERPTYFTFRTPIEVEIYGDDLAELNAGATAVRDRLERIPGLVDVSSSAELGNPELLVSFNREQLMQMGLDLSQVAETVRSKVQGNVATQFLQGDREIDILVRSVEVGKASVRDVETLIVAQKEGVPVPLQAVATVELTEGPSEIRRIGQKRAAVVSGNLMGRDMGSVAADVRRALAETALPVGAVAGLSGQEEEMTRSMRSLLLASALAIFLVYLVMASQFESLLHPFVIIFTLPMGLIGAVGALAIAGMSINVVAVIGMVMLAGIVVNNAIVLIDAVNQLRAEGMPRDKALIEAGLTRLRPILMTSATTILGLVPMALGLGEGAELRAPLAVTVIGGLVVGTILTLVVIPVVYTLLDRGKEPRRAEVAEDEMATGPTPEPV